MLPRGRGIIDVGSGAGSYEPADRTVVAVDASSVMLGQHPGPRRVRGAAEHLPFRDASFDAAMAIFTVHHWRDLDAGLAELRRVVDDLTAPILDADGEIYQYAGDEVVVTWPLAAGVRSANCVRCFFAIRDAIARGAARYRRDFGVVPGFRGGLHAGAVTAGELGDLRQQIVFVGDILNTAARLQDYARRMSLDLVVSGALLERLVLPPGVEARPCGALDLRGKEERVTAYGLTAASAPRV